MGSFLLVDMSRNSAQKFVLIIITLFISKLNKFEERVHTVYTFCSNF